VINLIRFLNFASFTVYKYWLETWSAIFMRIFIWVSEAFFEKIFAHWSTYTDLEFDSSLIISSKSSTSSWNIEFMKVDRAEFLLFSDFIEARDNSDCERLWIYIGDINLFEAYIFIGCSRIDFLFDLFHTVISIVISLDPSWFDFGERIRIFSMRGLVIFPRLICHHTVTHGCMHAWISAFVVRGQLSPVPVRLRDEVSLVFCDKLTGAQCPLCLSGERTRTGEWEIDWLVWYGEITSPPHLGSSYPQYLRPFQILNYRMHTVLKFTNLGKHKNKYLFVKAYFSSTHANVFIKCFSLGPSVLNCPDCRLVEVGPHYAAEPFLNCRFPLRSWHFIDL
jgi:hypothetical protein